MPTAVREGSIDFGRGLAYCGYTKTLMRAASLVLCVLVMALSGLSCPPLELLSPTEASYSEAEVEELIIVLVNEQRQHLGVSALSRDSLLTTLATEHSTSMAENGFFSHDRYPGERDLTHNQPPGTVRGENLSMTPTRRVIPGPYLSLQDVCEWAVSGWMNSPGHRDNMLRPGFIKTGVGVRLSDGYLYITQIFEGPY